MHRLDEWTADNLPSFGASALGILGGIVVVSMLAGGGAVGLLAGLILGTFLGWGAAILLHQWLVAGPMREKDARRSEEWRVRHFEELRRRKAKGEEMDRLRQSPRKEDRAEYKRRCQQEVDERSRRVAERKAEWKEIMGRGRTR